MLNNLPTYLVSGVCTLLATGLTTWQVINHLRHYTEPLFQRYIVRIIFMVPVYGICSWVSLIAEGASDYLDAIRVCYEAWIIYNFLALCLAYVGGPGAVEVKMNNHVLMPSKFYCTCCLPPTAVNGLFVRRCQQGTLQFVLLMPILSLVTLVLATQGDYTEGQWGPHNGYLWVTLMYNATYSVALYALLLFYLGTHELLAPFNPLLKFALVKSVVFLTFWQGLLISMLVGVGVIHSAKDGRNLQNFIICLEMVPASICLFFAFPYEEYKVTGPGNLSGGNVGHAISIYDVVSDTVHQFAPAYHDYVLYSDGGDGKQTQPKTFRTRTFVALGAETSRGKKDNSGLLQNMELGGMSSFYGNDSEGGVHHVQADGSSPLSPVHESNGMADHDDDDVEDPSVLASDKKTKPKSKLSQIGQIPLVKEESNSAYLDANEASVAESQPAAVMQAPQPPVMPASAAVAPSAAAPAVPSDARPSEVVRHQQQGGKGPQWDDIDIV